MKHRHEWGPWQYADLFQVQVRVCALCSYIQTRKAFWVVKLEKKEKS